MNVNLIPIKIKQRLNKLDSNDYDNIECWQYVEAFNKAQRDWVRRNLHGGNIYKEGDEETTSRIDDLNILLTKKELDLDKEGSIFKSENLPDNYFRYKRLDIVMKKGGCSGKKTNSNLIEVGNVSSYLYDYSLQPSFEWGETFHTTINNTIEIYTDGSFSIEEASLVYYRQPREISLEGCPDINGRTQGDIDPEFKDDLVEVLIDEAVSILSIDIESPNSALSSSNRVIKNN